MGKPKKRTKDGIERKILKDHNGSLSEGVLLRHVAIVRSKELAAKNASQAVAQAKKEAKKDGVDLKMLSRKMKQQLQTYEEMVAEHNQSVAYDRMLHFPIGAQMHFIEIASADDMTPEIIKTEAKNEGRQCALRGGSVGDNPHDANSDAGRAWLDGYDIGQSKLRDAMQFDMEEKNKKKAEATA